MQVSQSGAVTEAKPNYLKNPAPVYPILARNQGQQGLVELEVEINSDGQGVASHAVVPVRFKIANGNSEISLKY